MCVQCAFKNLHFQLCKEIGNLVDVTKNWWVSDGTSGKNSLKRWPPLFTRTCWFPLLWKAALWRWEAMNPLLGRVNSQEARNQQSQHSIGISHRQKSWMKKWPHHTSVCTGQWFNTIWTDPNTNEHWLDSVCHCVTLATAILSHTITSAATAADSCCNNWCHSHCCSKHFTASCICLQITAVDVRNFSFIEWQQKLFLFWDKRGFLRTFGFFWFAWVHHTKPIMSLGWFESFDQTMTVIKWCHSKPHNAVHTQHEIGKTILKLNLAENKSFCESFDFGHHEFFAQKLTPAWWGHDLKKHLGQSFTCLKWSFHWEKPPSHLQKGIDWFLKSTRMCWLLNCKHMFVCTWFLLLNRPSWHDPLLSMLCLHTNMHLFSHLSKPTCEPRFLS